MSVNFRVIIIKKLLDLVLQLEGHIFFTTIWREKKILWRKKGNGNDSPHPDSTQDIYQIELPNSFFLLSKNGTHHKSRLDPKNIFFNDRTRFFWQYVMILASKNCSSIPHSNLLTSLRKFKNVNRPPSNFLWHPIPIWAKVSFWSKTSS